MEWAMPAIGTMLGEVGNRSPNREQEDWSERKLPTNVNLLQCEFSR